MNFASIKDKLYSLVERLPLGSLRIDLRIHLIGGFAIAAAMIAVVLLAVHVSPQLALAVGVLLWNGMSELDQGVRGTGEPDPADAIAGSVPAWFLAIVWWVLS